MKVAIKRVDKNLPLPEYETKGAVAFDLITRVTTKIKPNSIERIPVNIIVKIPKGYMLFIKDRSSTAMKKGLLPTAGIIDQDFCGDGDEILFQVYNFKKKTVKVERGEKIGQAMFIKIDKASWQEVKTHGTKTRGGFGSTDKKGGQNV